MNTPYYTKAESDAIESNLRRQYNYGASEYRGFLEIADTPTLDGWYWATEIGTYTNAGGLVTVADTINIIEKDGSTYRLYDIENPSVTVVDGFNSTSTTEAGSANNDRLLNLNKVDKYEIVMKANLVAGKNLFNWEDVGIIRGAFMYDNGAQATYSEFSISGYIEILPSTNYYCNKVAGGGAYNTWYDENKVVISTFNSASASSPVNAKFVRYGLNVNDTDDISTKNIQVEQGTIATPYESYLLSIPSSELGNAALKTDIVTLHNKIDKQIGKNLFNKDADGVLLGHFISGNTLPTLSDFNVSDYIEVLPSTTYTHSSLALGGAECAYYTDEKVFISNFTAATFTTPSNAYFIRISIFHTLMDSAQVELGSVSTVYKPYTELGFLEQINENIPERTVSVILPKKLHFIKNAQACIYYENILFQNLNDIATVYFNQGKNNKRQATFDFSAAATNQILNSLLISQFKKIESKNITYDVIDGAVNNGKTVDALFIGDSFTDMGNSIVETKALMQAQGVTFNLLGTCGTTAFRAEGLSGGTLANTFLNNSTGVARIVSVTGMTTIPDTNYLGDNYSDSNGNIWTIRGGKIDGSGNGKIVVTKFGATNGTFSTFPTSGVLTKIYGNGDATINYSSPVSAYFNPFINHSTGVLDITNYITFWGFATPDVIVIQFTWNDLPVWATDSQISTVVANFKTAADHIHAAYPSSKVVFSIEPFGSVNGNLDYNGKKYSVLKFVEAMLIQFEDDAAYNTWVKIAPSYAFVDLVNGYGGDGLIDGIIPSERYPDVYERSGGDGVHPSTGMLQIADCIAPVISAII